MMLLLGAETRRLLRERATLAWIALTACILFASAVAGGLAARDWRATHAQARDDAQARRAAATQAARKGGTGDQARMATFQFARTSAPLAVLPPLGGLALASGSFALLSPDARVTVESRHTDHRRDEVLPNPLLRTLAIPDFAAMAALLLPLAILASCAGLVAHGRATGTWRLVAAQAGSPLAVLAAALAVRGGALYLAALGASCLAFALDPGAGASALAAWAMVLLGFCLWWMTLAGLLGLLRVSAAATVLGGVGLWVFTTFCAPALLAARLESVAPMPSRLAAVTALRAAQQDAEVRSDELLARWYAEHPGTVPPEQPEHTWPVTFMPRYIEQERLARPVLARFQQARVAQERAARPWLAAMPGLALTRAADALAGIDARRLAAHARAVDAYEDAWRRFFVPRIMAYRPLAEGDLAALPTFAPVTAEREPLLSTWLALGAACVAGWGVLGAARRRVAWPG